MAYPLTRPASWALAAGAPGMPLIRWGGAALWLAGAMVALIWLAALTEDILVGRVHPGIFLLALAGVLAWFALAWRIWRRWFFEHRPLMLQWRGPVVVDHRNARTQGGFHVAEWHAPVRVRLALSWQGWMLLDITRVDETPPPPSTYAWLDAREVELPRGSSRNTSLHQLRTLLHLPPSMTTQEGDCEQTRGIPGSQAPRPMASWADSIHPGSLVRRLASLFRTDRSSGRGTSRRLDTSFPVTTVERRATSRPARVRGGGR